MGMYYICQQLPVLLDNFDDKKDMIANESRVYKNLQLQQGMLKYVFNFKGNMIEEDGEDIWSNYRLGEQTDCYYSLYEILFKVSFDPKTGSKMYDVEHGFFYELITQENGMRHVAQLV